MSNEIHELAAGLIRHDVIEAAKNNVAAAVQRVRDSEADLVAASEAHRDADRKSRDVARKGGDVHASELVVEDAARRVKVLTRVVEGSKHALQDAQRAQEEANQIGHQPVISQALVRRFAAMKKADAAAKALAEAEDEFKASEALLRFGYSGFSGQPPGNLLGNGVLIDPMTKRPIRTADQERELWTQEQGLTSNLGGYRLRWFKG